MIPALSDSDGGVKMKNGNGSSWQAFWGKNSVVMIGFLILAVVSLFLVSQNLRFRISGVIDAVAQEKIEKNETAIKELQKEKADGQTTANAIAKVEEKVDRLDSKFDEKFDKLTTAVIEWKNSK